MQGNRQAQARDRQSIWSVPGHLWPWYIVIFVVQYFSFLGMTVWHEVVNRGSSGGIEVTLEVQKGMTASILNMAASTYTILEGIMLAQWLRERDQKKEQKAREHGQLEERLEWQAWLERMQTAHLEGVPFDEPPPGSKSGDKTET